MSGWRATRDDSGAVGAGGTVVEGERRGWWVRTEGGCGLAVGDEEPGRLDGCG
ncbi:MULTISPECIES: hypothetical protein [Halomicrobium]|uniref:hypothetical protein n=1 Tax=Halomicrobium TaxID=203135 RepID=UPI0013DF9734|nr:MULTISPECIES: hypothetical protein [Halomicrobium]